MGWFDAKAGLSCKSRPTKASAWGLPISRGLRAWRLGSERKLFQKEQLKAAAFMTSPGSHVTPLMHLPGQSSHKPAEIQGDGTELIPGSRLVLGIERLVRQTQLVWGRQWSEKRITAQHACALQASVRCCGHGAHSWNRWCPSPPNCSVPSTSNIIFLELVTHDQSSRGFAWPG